MPESLLNSGPDQAVNASKTTGIFGEELAAEFLIDNGYRVVMANFKVPVGRNSKGVQITGEIDIIGLEDGTLCFIEVKTRRSNLIASPIAAVDLRKQRQIIRTAKVYRSIFGVGRIPFRFDVVSVLLNAGQPPQIELARNFWTEEKFKKRFWQSASAYDLY